MKGRGCGGKVMKLKGYLKGAVSVNVKITVKYFVLYNFVLANVFLIFLSFSDPCFANISSQT